MESPSLDQRPEATTYRVEDLLELVRKGRLRVPQFQRKWQWGPSDVANLFDSLYRGYPAGTLLLWKRRGEETTLRIGPHAITVPARDDALWVVDGQQRITALAGVLISSQEAEVDPEFDLYFNLSRRTFTRPVRRRLPENDWIPMRVVVNAEDLFAWLDKYREHNPPKELVQLAVRLGKLIREYEIPAYVVDSNDENVLRHIFKRVNTAGKPLSESDVFDALYGAQGQSNPGELREVADRLVETGFGTFGTDVLLKTLRSLLGQDIATNYDMRLPEGTNTGEELARTERALRRVIDFFREEARIPHLRLLPYEMTVIALAVFFDKHPDPSARSRQLLSRWLWRGAITGAHRGDTVTLRSTLAIIRKQKESTTVSSLLRSLPDQSQGRPMLDQFNFRTSQSKLETLALLALDPKHLLTGDPVTPMELFATDEREILPMIVKVKADQANVVKELASTMANRIAHPPIQTRSIRHILRGDLSRRILESHGFSRGAWKKLKEGDVGEFLIERRQVLRGQVERILEARAAWSQSDRPGIKSLTIADE